MRAGCGNTFAGTVGSSGRRGTPRNQSVSGNGHPVAVYLHDFLRTVCRIGVRKYSDATVWDAGICLPTAESDCTCIASGCNRRLSNRRENGGGDETGRKTGQPAGQTASDSRVWCKSCIYGRSRMVCFRKRKTRAFIVGMPAGGRRDHGNDSIPVLSAGTKRMQCHSERRTRTICQCCRFSGARNGDYLRICCRIFGNWQLPEPAAGWNRTVDYCRTGSECRMRHRKRIAVLCGAIVCSRELFAGWSFGMAAKCLFSARKRNIDAAVFYQPAGTSAAQPVDYAGSRPDIRIFRMDGGRSILQFWFSGSVDW